MGRSCTPRTRRGSHRTIKEVQGPLLVRGVPHPTVIRYRMVQGGQPGPGVRGRAAGSPHSRRPRAVIEPWAVEPVDGWTLLPDGGPTLDWESEDDWLGLITDVAELQRHCQGHAAELAMLPSYEAAAAADRAEQLLADLARLPWQHAQHLHPDEARSCLRALPRLRDQLAVLDDAGPASTLQPNDAQPGNAVRATALEERRRLFDLGDAVWSHPWAVLHASGRGIALVPAEPGDRVGLVDQPSSLEGRGAGSGGAAAPVWAEAACRLASSAWHVSLSGSVMCKRLVAVGC